ncbi:yippee putative zinc-binding protein [Dictyocaulus viviparus]|uniref:ubiquitinyl hydrolase 1 n=1 Tax=Dictyocaulus viviparus TaxID=29172 RepID=A0A0D8XVF5_DICVI|nr:yippee putative zinc-binding protein [Dictyocaulus viviparus]
MGRIFIENHGGLRLVVCRFCRTYLTNRSELISSRFQGSSGSAMLFHRAWNLDCSEAQHRDMMTGKHIVRDVKCRICHERVGWMYEFAMEESQRYKEARVILEKALIDEEDGFPDPAGALETHKQPPPSPKFETFGGRRGRRLRFLPRSNSRFPNCHSGYTRSGRFSPSANSDDEYDVGFKDDALEADFALLLKRTRGFEIKVVRGDGSCMFRAVADQIYADEGMHYDVRRLCMDYMVSYITLYRPLLLKHGYNFFKERNRDHFAPFVTENFSSYVARKRRPGQYGNHVELQAISEMFRRPIEIYEYSENPRNIFYPTRSSLEVEIPIRLSYHGSSHYNSVVDPFTPLVEMGLGLPIPSGVDNLHHELDESEKLSLEQAILQSQLALTDIERTEKEISDQASCTLCMTCVAHDSYMDYLKMIMDHRDSSTLEINYQQADVSDWMHELAAKGDEVSNSGNPYQQKSTLYDELLAIEEWPRSLEEEEEALARALWLSEQEYIHAMNFRYGSNKE